MINGKSIILLCIIAFCVANKNKEKYGKINVAAASASRSSPRTSSSEGHYNMTSETSSNTKPCSSRCTSGASSGHARASSGGCNNTRAASSSTKGYASSGRHASTGVAHSASGGHASTGCSGKDCLKENHRNVAFINGSGKSRTVTFSTGENRDGDRENVALVSTGEAAAYSSSTMKSHKKNKK
jgi:hypothetical protein